MKRPEIECTSAGGRIWKTPHLEAKRGFILDSVFILIFVSDFFLLIFKFHVCFLINVFHFHNS